MNSKQINELYENMTKLDVSSEWQLKFKSNNKKRYYTVLNITTG